MTTTNQQAPVSSAPTISRQWQLIRRPSGWPVADDFRLAEIELPPLADGEVRVRNEFVSVDPYMRGRMNDVKSYTPPYVLGETMTGGAVGRVVESRSDSLAVGDLVRHFLGWRDLAQADAAAFAPTAEVPGVSSSAFLGALGMTSLTAWVGLLVIANMKPGDTVFVSGAAGAVGSAVGQLARLRGAKRVIGSAGSDEKVALLTGKYGFDAAFNYKNGHLARQLADAAPDGIDVYFDNVGGEHLEAALYSFNDGGRAALCGAISVYNETAAPSGPRNLPMITTKGLRLEGFTIGNYQQHATAFAAEVGPLLASGQMVSDETVIDGIDNALEAFFGLLRGENTGKMVVHTGA
ncbi:NADP-dependent oxidoreductase [Marisediminicola antarctica]|uniref:NADP-dependent oxidoreductase n=1 Tax=Marisediminicola antarctica TaxID=674079 RepID=A0A7L5AFK5_9MICO|nr:NADP-dependent oxidoreductase [Marisediminicola antarctica]QHO68742.1 NADP-dependent oxidoreductase [Marisediminicola antarctica]